MVTKSNRSGAKRRVSRNKSPLNALSQAQIPSFTSDAVQSLKLRYFVTNSYGSDVLSFAVELPVVPYGLSDNATTIELPFKSVRIKKIEMWCNYRPDGNIEGNTINLTCIERRTVRPIEWSDTATFLTPAHIKKKFMKTEPLGLWYSTTSGETNPEIRFQMPKGALLEITYDYILHDSENCGTSSGSGLSHPKIYSNRLHADVSVVGKYYAAVLAA